MLSVHVHTCSSLNEVEQHVVRGSIGLAPGAGTPQRQRQDIPLTGARRREEGGRQREKSETERRGDSEATRHFFLFSFFFLLALHFLISLPGRL